MSIKTILLILISKAIILFNNNNLFSKMSYLNKTNKYTSFNISTTKLLLKNTLKVKNIKLRKYIGAKLKSQEMINYYILGQFDGKFLLLKNKITKSIMILDQHAIHERILYESFTNNLLKTINPSHILYQQNNQYNMRKYEFLFKSAYSFHTLKKPIKLLIKSISIDNFDYLLIEGNNNILNFHIFCDKNHIMILSAPIIFDNIILDEEAVELLLNILLNFNNIFTKVRRSNSIEVVICNTSYYIDKYILIDIFSKQIKSKACRNAIMFNDILDHDIMNEIFNQIQKCENPFICAHGRHNFFILYHSNN